LSASTIQSIRPFEFYAEVAREFWVVFPCLCLLTGLSVVGKIFMQVGEIFGKKGRKQGAQASRGRKQAGDASKQGTQASRGRKQAGGASIAPLQLAVDIQVIKEDTSKTI
jgi:hypothetical protein